ncbi:hypothetical protein HYALB_00005591 [Hymenoscyphus albidus]|uniref:Uncharacterized protein n=1 Tax=Hymenoscyphus albidus TaxID=595503 RepID=A0A9N9Q508_9HELO|nr:hypothetical protein HYALB_00005591 [Hymenoscyphus albidus]
MSDDENDGPLTADEEREWEEMELNRIRQRKLAFQFDGTPTNLRHHQWLVNKRQRKHQKLENATNAKPKTLNSSEERAALNIEQLGEPRSRLTGIINPAEEISRSMELVAISSEGEVLNQMNVNLHSPRKDEWFGIVAIIDSGTEENWISEAIVTEYQLREEAGNPICCTDFGGGRIESDRCVKLTWRRERAKKTERAYFHVGKDAPFDVLFGSNIVRAAPALFRANTTEPALVLVQDMPSNTEKRTIEQNRTEHRARSQAVAERAKEKQQIAKRKQNGMLQKDKDLPEKSP